MTVAIVIASLMFILTLLFIVLLVIDIVRCYREDLASQGDEVTFFDGLERDEQFIVLELALQGAKDELVDSFLWRDNPDVSDAQLERLLDKLRAWGATDETDQGNDPVEVAAGYPHEDH